MSRFLPSLLLVACTVGLVWPPFGWGQSPSEGSPVVINEIQYAPNVPSNEFIELYNRSGTPVDLSRLSYADANRDFAPLTERSVLLEPDAYAVLVRDTAAFSNAFPSVEALTPAGWDALNNGGDTVFLRWQNTDTVVDSVPYAPSWGADDGPKLDGAVEGPSGSMRSRERPSSAPQEGA